MNSGINTRARAPLPLALLLPPLLALLSPTDGRAADPPKEYSAVKLDRSAMLKAPADLGQNIETVLEPPRQVRWTRITGLPIEDRQTLWSSWGDGCIASNQKYYTAIGDHRGEYSHDHWSR